MKLLITMLILTTVFLSSRAQGLEYDDTIDFQYAIAPSVGKHQLEIFLFSMNVSCKAGFADLAFGLEYQTNAFVYFNVPGINPLDSFEQFYVFSPTVGIAKELGKGWYFHGHARPVLSSNFSSGLSKEDFIPGYQFGLQKRWQGDGTFSVLDIGLEYGTMVSGKPGVFPILKYHKKIGEHFSVVLGYPSSRVTYIPSNRHTLDFSASLQGFYYNNSDVVVFNTGNPITDTKLVFNGLDVQATHLYRIQPQFTTVVRIGFLAPHTMEIATTEGLSLYDFSPNNSIYFSIGITYNLKMDLDGQKK
ncbi:MAG: hypothetical protein AAF634_05215 [Bacteroidota bacterium]